MSQRQLSRAPRYAEFGQHIDQVIHAALEAADSETAVRRNLSISGSELRAGATSFDTSRGKVYVVAAGKAAIPMVRATVDVLGGVIFRGVVITKSKNDQQLDQLKNGHRLPDYLQVYGAGHPVSDQRSITATEAAIDLLQEATESDLLLCLISGGTSSLLTKPLIPLADWQTLVAALLASGCTINELNTVRKRFDAMKGGGLAGYAWPAPSVSLILSDVIGNPLDVIGSGPTVANPDPSDLAFHVLNRYGLNEELADKIWQKLVQEHRAFQAGQESEELNVANYIVGDIRLAAEAAASAAESLGFETNLLTTHLEGEAREIGRVAAALAKDTPPGTCLILGGETTVTLCGDGLGGRNQELALAAAINLEGVNGAVVASFATDGDDGPTPAAGAIATGDTMTNALSLDIDARRFLDDNDSYRFFSRVGGLIQTGPTGTNVNDLLIILKYPVD